MPCNKYRAVREDTIVHNLIAISHIPGFKKEFKGEVIS